MLMMVVIKLMAPRMEETPAKCNEKMARSTDAPAWARLPAKGVNCPSCAGPSFYGR